MTVVTQIVKGIRNKKIDKEQIDQILSTLSKSEELKLMIALKELHSLYNESLIRHKESLLDVQEYSDSVIEDLNNINYLLPILESFIDKLAVQIN